MERAFERLLVALRLALGALMLASIALNGANVVGRYVFGTSIVWAEEVTVYIMVALVFLGAVLVAWDNEHLRMDLLHHALGTAWRRALDGLALAAMLAASVFVAWNAFRVVARFAEQGKRSVAAHIPMVLPHGAIFLGFALMALALVIRWRRIVSGRAEDAAEPPP